MGINTCMYGKTLQLEPSNHQSYHIYTPILSCKAYCRASLDNTVSCDASLDTAAAIKIK